MYSAPEEKWGSACRWFFSTLGVAAARVDRAAEGLVDLVDETCAVDNASAEQLAEILDRTFRIEEED